MSHLLWHFYTGKMILKSPLTISQLLLASFAVLAVLLVPASSAEAGFQSEQTALFAASEKDSSQMSQALDDILDVYIEASDDVYWNDAGIVAAFQSYLAGFSAFNQKLNQMWALSGAYYKERLRAFQRQLVRSKKKGAKPACVQRASSKRARGMKVFGYTKSTFERSLRDQAALQAETNKFSPLIFATSRPQLFDPSEMESWINATYDYLSTTNGVYLSGFYTTLSSAISGLKKCKPRR